MQDPQRRRLWEVPQVQHMNKIVDVLALAQRQVPTIETAQKTEEVPQVQILDRVVDAPVVMQPFVLEGRNQERIVGETIDVPMPHVMTEIVQAVKHILQERVQNNTVKRNLDRSLFFPQGPISHRNVEKTRWRDPGVRGQGWSSTRREVWNHKGDTTSCARHQSKRIEQLRGSK